MNDIKLRLSLCVPGAQMLSKQECLKNPKESFNTEKLNIEYTVGKGKNAKRKKETLVIKTRKSKLVKHNISISTSAYRHMVSPSEPPLSKYAKVVETKKLGPYNEVGITRWQKMSIKERLKVHLDLTAEHFNAVSYTYEVFED